MIDFNPHQILCLEHEEAKLYGEVIQSVAERHLYWLRPLALVQSGDPLATESGDVLDLRQGADLLCPMGLFRAALDTEVVPILTHLESTKSAPVAAEHSSEARSTAHQQLQAFVRRIWQAHPEAFRHEAP